MYNQIVSDDIEMDTYKSFIIDLTDVPIKRFSKINTTTLYLSIVNATTFTILNIKPSTFVIKSIKPSTIAKYKNNTKPYRCLIEKETNDNKPSSFSIEKDKNDTKLCSFIFVNKVYDYDSMELIWNFVIYYLIVKNILKSCCTNYISQT